MAAAIVVANPLAPPVRDLQISTTQLFTSPEAFIPFDKNLLKSISQAPPASDFNVALAQILGALAAEADRIGTEVNSNTSASLAPAAAGLTVTGYAPVSADVPAGAVPNGTPSAAAAVVPAAAAITTPTLERVVAEVTADTAYLGNKVVEAAYAAVKALVSTPDLIFQAVRAALLGDLSTAFATVVQAIKAFFDSGLILVGGIDDVVGQYGPPPITPPAGPSAAASDDSRLAAPAATAVDATESATEAATPAPEPGSGKLRPSRATSSVRRAGTEGTSQLTARSSASAPGTANSSHGPADTDSAEQPKAKASESDKAGSASSGRSPNAGGRGASARD